MNHRDFEILKASHNRNADHLTAALAELSRTRTAILKLCTAIGMMKDGGWSEAVQEVVREAADLTLPVRVSSGPQPIEGRDFVRMPVTAAKFGDSE